MSGPLNVDPGELGGTGDKWLVLVPELADTPPPPGATRWPGKFALYGLTGAAAGSTADLQARLAGLGGSAQAGGAAYRGMDTSSAKDLTNTMTSSLKDFTGLGTSAASDITKILTTEASAAASTAAPLATAAASVGGSLSAAAAGQHNNHEGNRDNSQTPVSTEQQQQEGQGD